MFFLSKIIHFRCKCQGCKNFEYGQNIEVQKPAKSKKKGNKQDQHSGKLPRTKDSDFYANLGLKTIKPRWTLEESFLLFLTMDNKVETKDVSKGNVSRILTRFNYLVSVAESLSVQLNKKSPGQIEGKIRDFLRNIGRYDRGIVEQDESDSKESNSEESDSEESMSDDSE